MGLPAKKTDWTNEECEAWRPPEKLTVSEWADKHRVLVSQTSAEPGPWRTDRTPYLKEPMNAFSDPYVEIIVLEFATQLGKTEFEYNCLGYVIDQDPASALVIMPTIDLGRYTSRNRIQPMINASDTLREKKPPNDDHFTLLEMSFPAMVLSIAGANSPASLATRPCRYLFLDEVNKFPKFTKGDEADPISLATERQKNFWNKKTLIVSTSTLEDGQVTKEREACDVKYHYHVACPECGAYQTLEFENIKWPDDLDKESPTYIQEVRESAWYQCPHCKAMIDDFRKPQMLLDGEWKSDDPKVSPIGQIRSKGYHLNSLYSPWLTWGDIATKFLSSKDHPEKFQNFYNSWLALPWVEKLHRAEEKEVLAHRTAHPPLIVPAKAIALTAGFDVQKDRFYYVVRAWAKDYTSWLIRYGMVMSWDSVYQIIFEDMYPIEGSDDVMRIWRVGMDTGGSEGAEEGVSSTEEVYSWLRDYGQGVVFGIKGSPRTMATRLRQTIIDRMPGKKGGKGKPIPGGLILWTIDTAKFKDVLQYRLEVEDGQAQSFYLHSEVGDDYARHITAEEKRRDKKGNIYWHQLRARNDYLDCEVYCAATVDPEWEGGLRVIAPRPKPKGTAPRPKVVKSNWMS